MKQARELISKLFDNINQQDLKTFSGLFSSWAKIAGTDIAAHSKVLEFDRQILYIGVDHPGWMQMIGFKKASILKALKKQYSDLNIKDLRLLLTEGVSDDIMQKRFSPPPAENKLSAEETATETKKEKPEDSDPVISEDFSKKLAKLGQSIEKKWQGSD